VNLNTAKEKDLFFGTAGGIKCRLDGELKRRESPLWRAW